jgi:hypothetical protein
MSQTNCGVSERNVLSAELALSLPPVSSHAPAPAPTPIIRPEVVPPPAPVLLVRVHVRLSTGDRVEVAAHQDERGARREATALMRYLRDGRGDWPFIGGAFIRPETIVSIQIQRD